jgi:hypothetical protein
MLRVAELIVRNRRAAVAVWLLLFIGGVWGMLNGGINYDLMSYLPGDLDSVRGFDIIDEQFDLGNTAQILVTGHSDTEVASLVERIRAIEGVEAVHWATDFG